MLCNRDACIICMHHKSLQLCPTLCDPMVSGSPGFSVHGDSPGKNTKVGCHALLQGTFPSRGSNPGLLHCRLILSCLSHQGSIILSNMLAFAFLSTMSLKLGTLLLTSRVLSVLILQLIVFITLNYILLYFI